jgi:hypothetical protein
MKSDIGTDMAAWSFKISNVAMRLFLEKKRKKFKIGKKKKTP